jgi:hypothetical protein
MFLDIEKTLDTTWYSGFLCTLSKLDFSTSLIKLICSFLSQSKFSVSVVGEMSTQKEAQIVVPQVLSCPLLYTTYTQNDALQTPGIYLALSAVYTCLYATDGKEGFLSENSSAGSAQWRTGGSAPMLKLMRIRHRGSTSLTIVDRLSPILY